jgi:chorismate-pyruvate lyase
MNPNSLTPVVRDTACETSASAFDPLAGVFAAQSARPAGVAPVVVQTLRAEQRALLVIDGTVTTFLEAWALEPVAVVRLAQEQLKLAAAEPWLELSAGAAVIRRRVILQGRHSGRFFAWADSLIGSERLPLAMGAALAEDGGGLGRILLDSRIETRRECLWYGRDKPAEIPPLVSRLWSGEFLVRSYRVIGAGRPLMLITERFPL